MDGAFIPELFGASPCVVRKLWNEVEARVILVHLTEAGNSLCGLEFVGLCLVDAFISTFNGEDLLGDCVVVTVGSEDSTREIKTEAERVKVGVCTEGEETFLEDSTEKSWNIDEELADLMHCMISFKSVRKTL